MNERVDAALLELLQDFFSHEVTAELVADVERMGAVPTVLWDKAEGIGLAGIGIPEADGGMGGTLADVVAIARAVGRHTVPLPLVEHHLGTWLAASAGLGPLEGRVTIAGLDQDIELGSPGVLRDVAWARDSQFIVLLGSDASGRDAVGVLARDDVSVEPGTDLAQMPLDTVVPAGPLTRVAQLPGSAAAVRQRASLLASAVLSGLVDGAYELTARYVSERHQFGKPVGAFQAVQAHVVSLAQSASMARLVVDRAVDGGSDGFEVGAAAVVARDCALTAATAAHQAHGAIGMTREYPLQLLTRRIHAWRQRWESETDAQERVGDLVLVAPSFARLVSRHPEEAMAHD